MANVTILEIEDAMLSAIRAHTDLSLVSNGGYSRTIDSYAGQFELDNVQDILIQFPAVFVIFVEASYTPASNRETEADPAIFTILVADQNLRGNKESRRGEVGGIGTYRMMEDVRDLLQGQQLGLVLDPFQLRRQVAVVNNNELSIYAMEFGTKFLVATV